MRVVHVLRKPLAEASVAGNVLKHGCGAVNIDRCRIRTTDNTTRPSYGTALGLMNDDAWEAHDLAETGGHVGGRWPANLILEHQPGCRKVGERKVRTHWGQPTERDTSRPGYDGGWVKSNRPIGYADEDGLETIDEWDCEPGCPVAEIGFQSGRSASPTTSRPKTTGTDFGLVNDDGWQPSGCTIYGYGDEGGASRFFKRVGGSRR